MYTRSGFVTKLTLSAVMRIEVSSGCYKQIIGLKPGTSWSRVYHSTTKPIGKEGMVHEFGSFHMGNS